MEVQLGRQPRYDPSLITKFAAAQVKYYQSKFAVYFKSYNVPINTITIDENKIVHGFLVSTNRVQSDGITAFAKQMQGIMKVHRVHVRTMKNPEVTDLN